MVRVTDSLLPQIATDLAVTVGAASIVVTAYSWRTVRCSSSAARSATGFGKYYACAALRADRGDRGVAVRAVAIAAGTGGLSPGLRPCRGLHHPDRHGLCRRRGALRTSPTGARATSSPDRFPAYCSDRSRAAFSATGSAGATCSSSSPACCGGGSGADRRTRLQSAYPRLGQRTRGPRGLVAAYAAC